MKCDGMAKIKSKQRANLKREERINRRHRDNLFLVRRNRRDDSAECDEDSCRCLQCAY